jgi:hypothetical protein
MSPEEMQRQMKGAQAQAAGQHDYFFKVRRRRPAP